MHLAQITRDGRTGLVAKLDETTVAGHLEGDPAYPGSLAELLSQGVPLADVGAKLRASGTRSPLADVQFLPPLVSPSKILCVGLNYRDHAAEAGMALPDYPTLFTRFASSLVAHGQPLVRPRASTQLDYEAELVAVIGKRGRHIPRDRALEHVVGYSLFNDASVRDFQLRTGQWTAGKNFDGTGAFGPWLTLASALPPGARGLHIETKLNGEVLQSASTDQMIFDVPELVAVISAFLTLEPGDIIVTGTPSGVGFVRKPALFMKAGDVCEVAIEGLGTLRNPVVDER
ncbi:MAG: fumarylacetoacetate hydrolase family protein [Polyangiales bacterium]